MSGMASTAGFRPSLLLASCIAAAFHAPATADTRTEVRVSGGVGVENNPFLNDQDNDAGAAVTAEIQVEPSLYIEDERTTFRIYGNLRLRQFFEDYGTDASVLVGVTGSTRLDERTRLSGGARFQSSRSAAQDAFLLRDQDLIGLEPGALPDVPIIDPTIPWARRRTNRFGADGSLERQLTPRDQVSLGLAFNESHTSGDVGFDYRVADLLIGYGRSLDERTTLRGTVALSRSDLLEQTAGDAISVTPLIGVQQQVSERLNWSAQVGLSYSRIDDGIGGDVTSTTIAFMASGCRRDARGTLCVTAQRQPRPTTFGGFTNTTGINIGYDLALSRIDSIGFNATYQRSERLASTAFMEAPTDQDDDLIGLGVNYRRAFTDRLSGFANASYSKISSDLFPDRDANLRALVGVSYVFGRQQ